MNVTDQWARTNEPRSGQRLLRALLNPFVMRRTVRDFRIVEVFEKFERLEMSKLTEALRNGQQADEDGVMCVVSRQACHEAADRIDRLERVVAEIWKSFYGQNMQVENWHQNGELEPMDSFFESNDWSADKSA